MQGSLCWYGHNTWGIELPDAKIVLDPFFDGNPSCPVRAENVEADWILISHGHEDHTADVVSIQKRCDARLVANFEIAQYYSRRHGIEGSIAVNPGGGVDLPFGRLRATLAQHSSSMPDGTYAGCAGGYLLTIEGRSLYFACDTAYFGDMAYIGRTKLDFAAVPIGDLYTMGPEDSIQAILDLSPAIVAPCHFGTWPPIEQDADKWAASVRAATKATPRIFMPGETVSFDALFSGG